MNKINESIWLALSQCLTWLNQKGEFDKTRKGVVLAIPSINHYTVMVAEKQHTIKSGLSLSIGDTVYVTSPCNIDEQMYIVRKADNV